MGTRYQTMWRRFLALLVDTAVFIPLILINWYVLRNWTSIATPILVTWHASSSLLWFAYSIYFHGKYGQTLGKMVAKVRVIDCSESKAINFRQAFARDGVLLLLTLAFLPHESGQVAGGTYYRMLAENAMDPASMIQGAIIALWALAEVSVMCANRKRRTVHDLIARTVVVRTDGNRA